MNALVANSLVGSDKFLPNKGSPVCLGDRAERIMCASAVERPSAIHKHFLKQMLPAAEKDVSDIFVVLDDAAKFLLHPIIAIFENLLKLVENNHDIPVACRGDFCRRVQHLVQRCAKMGAPSDSKADFRSAFFIDRHGRRETTEKSLCDL